MVDVFRRDPAADFNPRDAKSRRRWRNAMTGVMMMMHFDVLQEIAGGGFDKFKAVSHDYWRGHALKVEDVRFIYDAICAAIKSNYRFSVPECASAKFPRRVQDILKGQQ